MLKMIDKNPDRRFELSPSPVDPTKEVPLKKSSAQKLWIFMELFWKICFLFLNPTCLNNCHAKRERFCLHLYLTIVLFKCARSCSWLGFCILLECLFCSFKQVKTCIKVLLFSNLRYIFPFMFCFVFIQ